ncbi:MAG: thioredoxin family protein [Isosphaeraceae bacterium]|nr:thioredoxin family protein [Isosphaeraceae bacterium]
MTRPTTWAPRGGPNAIVFLIAAAVLPSTIQPSIAGLFESQTVPWRTDLGTAQVEAKKEDRVLWLQFTGPWCPNCRRMDRGAFIHPTVVGLARESFVPIKLRSDEFESLALDLGLTVLPSTVLVRPNGEVIAKQEGYLDSTEFYAFLQQSLMSEGRLGAQRIARGTSPGPIPPAPSPVALAAYCPVSLVDGHRLLPGKPELTARYQGLEYRFSSVDARAEFLRRPDRYIPVNAGRSPVAQVDQGVAKPGDPRWGVTYRGRFYLCAEGYERDLFMLNPERYAHVGEIDRTRLGDLRGLWALSRPSSNRTVPAYDRTPAAEPLRLQALRSPEGSMVRR